MRFSQLTILLLFTSLNAGMVSCQNKSTSETQNIRQNTPKSSVTKETNTAKKVEGTKEVISSMDPEQIKQAQALIDGADNSKVEGLDGKKLFRTHCAICHGFKGNMKINGAKDLTKSSIPLVESVAQVYFGKGLMTPYKGILSDEEIISVSKYAESLRE